MKHVPDNEGVVLVTGAAACGGNTHCNIRQYVHEHSNSTLTLMMIPPAKARWTQLAKSRKGEKIDDNSYYSKCS